MSFFASEKQRKAAMARITGGGGDVLSGRRLGMSWGRRTGNKGRLAFSSPGTRDKLLVQRAASRIGFPEASKEFALAQSREKREARARHLAQIALLKALGVGTGLAALGGAVYVGASPRAQIAVGRYLMNVKHVLPVGTAKTVLRATGQSVRGARVAVVKKVADKAAGVVRMAEEKLLGPKTVGGFQGGQPAYVKILKRAQRPHEVVRHLGDLEVPSFKVNPSLKVDRSLVTQLPARMPFDPRDVALHPRGVKAMQVQDWLREQNIPEVHDIARARSGKVLRQKAGTAREWARQRYQKISEGPGVDAGDDIQPTVIDKADAAWKRALTRARPHPIEQLKLLLGLRQMPARQVHLFGVPVDPEFAFKYGNSDRVEILRQMDIRRAAQRSGFAKVSLTPGEVRKAGEPVATMPVPIRKLVRKQKKLLTKAQKAAWLAKIQRQEEAERILEQARKQERRVRAGGTPEWFKQPQESILGIPYRV